MIYMDNRSSHFLGIANDQIYDKRHQNYCISICFSIEYPNFTYPLFSIKIIEPILRYRNKKTSAIYRGDWLHFSIQTKRGKILTASWEVNFLQGTMNKGDSLSNYLMMCVRRFFLYMWPLSQKLLHINNSRFRNTSLL